LWNLKFRNKQINQGMIAVKTPTFLLFAIFLVPVLISKGQKPESNENEVNKSVKIDNQVWMAENLNVGNFRNGDPVPEARTEEEWERAGKEGKPAWCYYENKIENGVLYGKLYNWYAVTDPRGLAPPGWHVPTDAEWRQVTLFLGGEDAAGTKMKSPSGWTHDGNGTNVSGFRACRLLVVLNSL